VLVQVLEILTRDDLQALQHNSPTYIHLLAEAMQFAFADRAAYYGDPDFVNVPLAMLLAPSRTVQLRNRISSATTYSPKFYGEGASNSGHGTSHLSVIDGNGNAVALTTSINTAFGSMLVADGTGIILNSTMDDFSAQPGAPNVYGLIGNEANAVAPRKRPLSSMTPSIVLKDGSVVAAAGASGGPLIISGTLQVLLNTVVFGLDADSAVGSARVHHQWLPPVLAHEPAIGELTRRALKRLGHSLHEIEGIGAVQLARRHSDGLLEGASDPRKGGKAAAW
jgi:gamma-glutamyltranspeptidase/glutathione hydrolase